MKLIDKIVISKQAPMHNFVLWIDSLNKKLKFKGNDGWEAVNDETSDVEQVSKKVETISNSVSSVYSTANQALKDAATAQTTAETAKSAVTTLESKVVSRETFDSTNLVTLNSSSTLSDVIQAYNTLVSLLESKAHIIKPATAISPGTITEDNKGGFGQD